MDELQLEQLTQQYMNHCRFEKGLDSKTLKAYNTDLAQFIGFVSDVQGWSTMIPLVNTMLQMPLSISRKTAIFRKK